MKKPKSFHNLLTHYENLNRTVFWSLTPEYFTI